MEYAYIKEDILNNKVSYSYSDYKGIEFINNWIRIRTDFINKVVCKDELDLIDFASNYYVETNCENSTENIFNNWILDLVGNRFHYTELLLLLKRFEVTKRIYGRYDSNFRPLDKQDYQIFLLYIKFGCVLVLAYKSQKKMQFLNALLKLLDILCSSFDQLKAKEKQALLWLLENEIGFVEKFMCENGIK